MLARDLVRVAQVPVAGARGRVSGHGDSAHRPDCAAAARRAQGLADPAGCETGAGVAAGGPPRW